MTKICNHMGKTPRECEGTGVDRQDEESDDDHEDSKKTMNSCFEMLQFFSLNGVFKTCEYVTAISFTASLTSKPIMSPILIK